ncbi:hypothetical protein LINPERHAP2_LOCUS39515, partial [Linum perenne]
PIFFFFFFFLLFLSRSNPISKLHSADDHPPKLHSADETLGPPKLHSADETLCPPDRGGIKQWKRRRTVEAWRVDWSLEQSSGGLDTGLLDVEEKENEEGEEEKENVEGEEEKENGT